MSYGKMRAVHSIEARLGRTVYGRRVVFRSNHNATLLALALEQVADSEPFS